MSNRNTEVEFQRRAEEAMQELERAFGALADDRDIDVDVQGGVLTINFEEGEPGKFIVSPNSSVCQLWVSARMSSYKLDWSDDERTFVLAGTCELLKALMTRLTREQIGDSTIDL